MDFWTTKLHLTGRLCFLLISLSHQLTNALSIQPYVDTLSEYSEKTFDITLFREEYLKHSNHVRRNHGVPDLQLLSELNSYAQSWAEHLGSQSDAAMVGHSKGPYGECLWSGKGMKKPDAKQIVDGLYSERTRYNYYDPFVPIGNEGDALHFTQMVWSGTRFLGVGAFLNPYTGWWNVVASYDPPGNIVSEMQFKENVLPPLAA